MHYVFVTPDGHIAREKDSALPPDAVAPNKGRWIEDVPPVYDPARHTLERVTPIPSDAITVPYQLVPVDLAAAKASRLAWIEEKFRKRQQAAFVFNAKDYDGDTEARTYIAEAVAFAASEVIRGAIPTSFCRNMLTMYGELVPFTHNDLFDLGKKVSQRSENNIERLVNRRLAVASAASLDELDAIDW